MASSTGKRPAALGPSSNGVAKNSKSVPRESRQRQLVVLGRVPHYDNVRNMATSRITLSFWPCAKSEDAQFPEIA
jgi:hypothetical protein